MAYARSSRIFEMDPERPAWVQKTAFLQEEKSAYPPSAIAVVSPWLRACVELFLEVQKKFCVSYLRTKTFCLVRMCQKRALGQLRQPEFATAYYKINFLPTYWGSHILVKERMEGSATI